MTARSPADRPIVFSIARRHAPIDPGAVAVFGPSQVVLERSVPSVGGRSGDCVWCAIEVLDGRVGDHAKGRPHLTDPRGVHLDKTDAAREVLRHPIEHGLGRLAVRTPWRVKHYDRWRATRDG
eukprot:scaffold6639_cov63-Phaeocystis_antarctica.AAC.1